MRKLKWWETASVASFAVVALASGTCASGDNSKGEDCNSGKCASPGAHCSPVGSEASYHGVWYLCTKTATDGDEWVKENPQPK